MNGLVDHGFKKLLHSVESAIPCKCRKREAEDPWQYMINPVLIQFLSQVLNLSVTAVML